MAEDVALEALRQVLGFFTQVLFLTPTHTGANRACLSGSLCCS